MIAGAELRPIHAQGIALHTGEAGVADMLYEQGTIPGRQILDEGYEGYNMQKGAQLFFQPSISR